MNLNRAVFIILGFTLLGFLLWVIWVASGIASWVTGVAGSDFSLMLSVVVCYGTGALIGDGIGKWRHYMLPTSS
jgi:hypothetical protein